MVRTGATFVTVVSDDVAWTNAVRSALRERGVGCIPLVELCCAIEQGSALPALLLDANVEPHGGVELGAELAWVLEGSCPPLLLAAAAPGSLHDDDRERFVAVVPRSADPSEIAEQAAWTLARLPASSGCVLRSVRHRKTADDS